MSYELDVLAPEATEAEKSAILQSISDHILAVARDFYRRTGKEIAITFDASCKSAKD